jgi:glucokinase
MAFRGGIDLGGTKIQAVIVSLDDQVVGQARLPTPRLAGPPGVAIAMAEALRLAADVAGIESTALTGVGIGCPGAVDEATGDVARSPNIEGWEASFPLGATVAEALGTRVVVGNDVDVATEAEFVLGAAKPYRSVLGVFWGTGVGGGLVLNGERWTGRGAAGEIGHVVIAIEGELCGCGRRGCMEAYAGRGNMEARARRLHDEGRRTELFRIMERRGKDRLSSGVWAEALEKGDHLAIRIVDRAVDALGAGVASAVNLLDVEAVIIGGGLGTRLGQPMADRILEAMMPHLFVADNPPPVLVAALGDLGGAIGASLRVR